MIEQRETHLTGSEIAPGMTLIRTCDRGGVIPHQRCPDGMHYLKVLSVRPGAGCNRHIQVSTGLGYTDEVVVRANETYVAAVPLDWARAARGTL